jgi:hypothetical protein
MTPRTRIWFAGVIAATLVAAGIGMLFNIVPLQAIAVCVFLLIEVGMAPLLLVRPMSAMWFWVLSIALSITTTFAVGFFMATTYFWSPQIAFGALVVITVALLALAVLRDIRMSGGAFRMRTAAVASRDRGRHRNSLIVAGATGLGLVVVVVTSAAAAGAPQPGGFYLSVSPVWYAGVALIVASAVWARSAKASAAAPILALSTVTVLSQAIAYGAPTVMSAARHVGIVDYIRVNEGSSAWLDIYQAWSGMFAGIAWLCDVANISDAMVVATWWPVLISPAAALAVAALASRWTTGEYRIWFAAALFALTGSLNTTYFSPQSTGLFISIVIFALAAVPRSRPERTPFMARWPRAMRLQRLAHRLRYSTQPLGPARMLLILYLACVLAVTHQISPYLASAALIILVVFGYIRPWWMPLLVLGPAVAWALFNSGVLDQFVSWSAVGQIGRNIAPPFHSFTELPMPAVTQLAFRIPAAALLVVGIVALITVLQHRNRVALALLLVAASPASLFFATDYGQEGIFRVVLFATPWLAIIAAGFRWRWKGLAIPVLAAGLATLCFINLYGQTALDWNRVVRQDAAEATRYFEEVAPPGSAVLIMGSGNATPGSRTAKYLDLGYVSRESLGGYPAVDRTYDPDRDVELLTENFAGGWGASNFYALVSESTGAYGERYGFQSYADFEKLAEAMKDSPLWDPIYEGPTTTLYELSDFAKGPQAPQWP